MLHTLLGHKLASRKGKEVDALGDAIVWGGTSSACQYLRQQKRVELEVLHSLLLRNPDKASLIADWQPKGKKGDRKDGK